MYYSLLTSVLVEGVKEQQSQIEALKMQNEQLQRQVDEIASMLKQLKVREELMPQLN